MSISQISTSSAFSDTIIQLPNHVQVSTVQCTYMLCSQSLLVHGSVLTAQLCNHHLHSTALF